MKNVFTSLSKSVLMTLGLMGAMSATDEVIQNKILRCGITALIISNKKVNHIMEIVKLFGDSGLIVTKQSDIIIKQCYCIFLIKLPHLLTNFETQKYYQNKPRFNGLLLGNCKFCNWIKDFCNTCSN